MVDPRVALVIIGIAMIVWLGGEIKTVTRKVGSKIVHVLKKVPHPNVTYHYDPKP